MAAERRNINIYDYPEHLNPFYEDDVHNRIRFWDRGKKIIRSGSFTFSDFKSLPRRLTCAPETNTLRKRWESTLSLWSFRSKTKTDSDTSPKTSYQNRIYPQNSNHLYNYNNNKTKEDIIPSPRASSSLGICETVRINGRLTPTPPPRTRHSSGTLTKKKRRAPPPPQSPTTPTSSVIPIIMPSATPEEAIQSDNTKLDSNQTVPETTPPTKPFDKEVQSNKENTQISSSSVETKIKHTSNISDITKIEVTETDQKIQNTNKNDEIKNTKKTEHISKTIPVIIITKTEKKSGKTMDEDKEENKSKPEDDTTKTKEVKDTTSKIKDKTLELKKIVSKVEEKSSKEEEPKPTKEENFQTIEEGISIKTVVQTTEIRDKTEEANQYTTEDVKLFRKEENKVSKAIESKSKLKLDAYKMEDERAEIASSSEVEKPLLSKKDTTSKVEKVKDPEIQREKESQYIPANGVLEETKYSNEVSLYLEEEKIFSQIKIDDDDDEVKLRNPTLCHKFDDVSSLQNGDTLSNKTNISNGISYEPLINDEVEELTNLHDPDQLLKQIQLLQQEVENITFAEHNASSKDGNIDIDNMSEMKDFIKTVDNLENKGKRRSWQTKENKVML